MASELAKTRFTKLCNAIKAVNTVEGITNAEVMEISNTRALILVKTEQARELYAQLEKRDIHPLIIAKESATVIYSARVNELDAPAFVNID